MKLKIANPAYDAVFKFMLEDKEAAKVFLSELLEEEVIDLELIPKEFVLKLDDIRKGLSIKLHHLDFKAIVRDLAGAYKNVLIELQRYRHPWDLYRFRRYIGQQYLDKKALGNVKTGEIYELVIAYIFGFTIFKEDYPIVYYIPTPFTRKTRKIINFNYKPNEVKALTHQLIFVQLPIIHQQIPTDSFEQFLQLFDIKPKSYYFEIETNQFPSKYLKLLNRLHMALGSVDILELMRQEDEYLLSLEPYKEEIANLKKELSEFKKKYIELERSKQELERRSQELERSKQELERRSQELERRSQELERSKQELERSRYRVIEYFLSKGLSYSEIAEILGMSEEEVRRIIGRNGEIFE